MFTLATGNGVIALIVSNYKFIILPVSDGQLERALGIGTSGYVHEGNEPGVRDRI